MIITTHCAETAKHKIGIIITVIITMMMTITMVITIPGGLWLGMHCAETAKQSESASNVGSIVITIKIHNP